MPAAAAPPTSAQQCGSPVTATSRSPFAAGSRRRRHRDVRRRDCDRPVGGSALSRSIPSSARPSSKAAPSGATSTRDAGARPGHHGRHRRATPVSAASAWAAALAGSSASTGFSRQPRRRPRWSPPRATFIRASASDHPDLFWAVRGGGGNFGIVELVPVRAAPVGPTVNAGPVFWRPRTPPTSCASTASSSPTRPTSSAPSSGSAPSRRPAVDEDLHFSRPSPWRTAMPDPSKTVSVPSTALRRVRDPARRYRRPTLYVDHQSAIDDTVPTGGATTGRPRTRGAVRRGHRHRRRARLPRHLPEVVRGNFHMGGAVARVPHDATAYTNRGVGHDMSIDAFGSPTSPASAPRKPLDRGVPRSPPTPRRRRVRELPRRRRRHESRPRCLRRRHLPAARRGEGGITTLRTCSTTTRTSSPARRGGERSPLRPTTVQPHFVRHELVLRRPMSPAASSSR